MSEKCDNNSNNSNNPWTSRCTDDGNKKLVLTEVKNTDKKTNNARGESEIYKFPYVRCQQIALWIDD